jgi:4-amino-4-deoxy-L-arabinose transferase-like glycosyltransferase
MSETCPRDRSFLFAALVVGGMTAWRALVLAFDSPLLSFDEAQYWTWAQTLHLGYYSKPPMVAWAIAATTALCGEAEGCVKAGAMLAQTATACLLYLLGSALYGRRVGAWAAVLWAVMPAVSLSSMVITTDPFLLVFWAAGLLALVKAVEAEKAVRAGGAGAAPNRWWVLLGVSFGLGLLAKYAMVLFALSLALWLAITPARRSLVKARGLWLAAGVGLLIYAPNAAWNAANGFVSYKHTKDNANLAGPLFHPDKLLEFLAGQFAVAGPLVLAGVLVALVLALRKGADPRGRMLAAFTLPLLLIMTTESLLSRANANWTAPAYLAGTVLAAAFLAARAAWVLKASLALHLLAAGVLYNLDAARRLVGLPDSARYDIEKRLKGWDEVGRRVSMALAAHPGARLLGDERKVLATLIYYVRPHPFDAVKWNPDGVIHDHFDQTTRLEPGAGEYIYVTQADDRRLRSRFEQVEKLADVVVPIHADYRRAVTLWRLSGFKGY